MLTMHLNNKPSQMHFLIQGKQTAGKFVLWHIYAFPKPFILSHVQGFCLMQQRKKVVNLGIIFVQSKTVHASARKHK